MPDASGRPTVVSLFSGIGGFDLGFSSEGFRITHMVEFDDACRELLSKRFPDAELLGDITEVHGGDLLGQEGEVPDVVVGGFPCQDISIAGRRTGLIGGRSGLWFEFHRILSELRAVDGQGARWVVIENVAGLLSSNKGRDLGTVLGALGDLGLGWAYRVVDSQYVGCCWHHAGASGWGRGGGDDGVSGGGALPGTRGFRAVPQRRRRIFVVGCAATGWRGAAEVLLEPEGIAGDPPTREPKGQGPAIAVGGRAEAEGGTGTGPGGPAGREGDPRDAPANALTLNGLGGGGPDDNMAQGGHLVPQEPDSTYAVRMRQGKPGGGKGALVSEDVSLTLATGNDQTLFAPAELRDYSEDYS